MSELAKLIEKPKSGDKEALLEIVLRFKPAVKKFSKELNYPEAESDLIITIIELVKKIHLENFSEKNDGALIKYIYLTLRNRKIDFFKKNILHHPNEEPVLNLEIIQGLNYGEIFEEVLINDILKPLPALQKEIIIKRILQGYSDKEIAGMYDITKQAVNRTKNRALINLRKNLVG